MIRSLNGLPSSNVYVNTISDGEAIEIVSSSSTAATPNLSMKTNTSEQTSPNANDWILLSDNSTGKIVKRILYSNFTTGLDLWSTAGGLLYPSTISDKVLIGTTSTLGSGTAKLQVSGGSLLNGPIIGDNILLKDTANAGLNFERYDGSSYDTAGAIKPKSGSNHLEIVNGSSTLTLPTTAGTLALTTDIPSAIWTIYDTRKIRPSTSSINYLFLENTTTDNALNPTIELKSAGGNSLIYDAKTDPALVIERNGSYFKLYQTGIFEFINNQKLSILSNTGASTRLELHYDSSNKFNIKVPTIATDVDLTIPNTSGTLCLDTGSTNITSVGTIATGTWSGTTIAVAKGGTGQTSYTNGQLLIGNTTGNTLTKSTLTAGSNITITNSAGGITIAAASASSQIESAENISTASILGNPIRTYGNSLCENLIQGTSTTINNSLLIYNSTEPKLELKNDDNEIWSITNDNSGSKYNILKITADENSTATEHYMIIDRVLRLTQEGDSDSSNPVDDLITSLVVGKPGAALTSKYMSYIIFHCPLYTTSKWVHWGWDDASSRWMGYSLGSSVKIQWNDSGNFYTSGAVNPSDSRIKKQIINADLDEVHNLFNSIELKKYKYTDNYRISNNTTDGDVYGFLADDIYNNDDLKYITSTLPKLSLTNNGVVIETIDNLKVIDKSKLLTLLWGECKRLNNRIDTLETQMNLLINSKSFSDFKKNVV